MQCHDHTPLSGGTVLGGSLVVGTNAFVGLVTWSLLLVADSPRTPAR